MKINFYNPMLKEAEAVSTKPIQKKNPSSKKQDKELMEACRQFESIFLNILLKQMRKTVPESKMFPKSLERDVYQSMLDQTIAKRMSKSKGLGLAEMVYQQLNKQVK